MHYHIRQLTILSPLRTPKKGQLSFLKESHASVHALAVANGDVSLEDAEYGYTISDDYKDNEDVPAANIVRG